MSDKHTPVMWQASCNGGKTWNTVEPTKTEPTAELRVAHLRTIRNHTGRCPYVFRTLYVGTPLVEAAQDLLDLAHEFEAFAGAAMNDADEEGDALGIVVWAERLRNARAAIAKAAGDAA